MSIGGRRMAVHLRFALISHTVVHLNPMLVSQQVAIAVDNRLRITRKGIQWIQTPLITESYRCLPGSPGCFIGIPKIANALFSVFKSLKFPNLIEHFLARKLDLGGC